MRQRHCGHKEACAKMKEIGAGREIGREGNWRDGCEGKGYRNRRELSLVAQD